MKIILFSRDQIDHRPQQMAQVFRAIERNGFTFAVNEEFARIVAHTLGRVIDPADIYRDTTGPQPRESVMVCYGGDGTLLEGIQRLSDKSIPVAGINFGHLGFLTTATREGVDALFDDIARGRLLTQPRTMLRIDGVRGESSPTTTATASSSQHPQDPQPTRSAPEAPYSHPRAHVSSSRRWRHTTSACAPSSSPIRAA